MSLRLIRTHVIARLWVHVLVVRVYQCVVLLRTFPNRNQQQQQQQPTHFGIESELRFLISDYPKERTRLGLVPLNANEVTEQPKK